MPLGDLAQEGELPGRVARMARQAGELDLVHGEDHRARAAGAAKNGADVGDVGGACTLAAKVARHQHAEQFALAQRRESLSREAGFAIDRVGKSLGDLGDRFGAGDEIERTGCVAGSGASVARGERADVLAHNATPKTNALAAIRVSIGV